MNGSFGLREQAPFCTKEKATRHLKPQLGEKNRLVLALGMGFGTRSLSGSFGWLGHWTQVSSDGSD